MLPIEQNLQVLEFILSARGMQGTSQDQSEAMGASTSHLN